MCEIFNKLKELGDKVAISETIIGTACDLRARCQYNGGDIIRITGSGADPEVPGEYNFTVSETEMSKVCARYFGLKAAGRAWDQTGSYNDGDGQDSWNWDKKPPLKRDARRHSPAVAHVIHHVAQNFHITCGCYQKKLYRDAAKLDE